MTWLEEIVKAFESSSGPMELKEIYDYIRNNTTRELTENYRAIIRRVIESFSSDSQVFQGNTDLFKSTYGIGKGVWELRISESSPIAVDITEPSLPGRIHSETNRIIRDTKLSKSLKKLYDNKCQICGKTITLCNNSYSEAHHIKPLGHPHNGPDIWGNILILCPNHHVEFDYGAIAIDPKSKKVIHINESSESHGLKIRINLNHEIDPVFLNYHLIEIFNKS